MKNQDKRHAQLTVPDDLIAQWQSMMDIMAKLAGIPAGLIMRIDKEDIEVFVASSTEGNPYHPGDREHLLNSGLYCETVINTKQPLLVPDALSDHNWKDNPDVKLNMISYLGLPIKLPDGKVFGTICILDKEPNSYNDTIQNLLGHLRDLIQQHLSLLYINAQLGEKNASIMEYLGELRTLRGLIPICACCKKIKDSDGYWNAVEKYLIHHPEAEFTHSYCPQCSEKMMKDLEVSQHQSN